jgi:hypothetical protein
MKKEIEKLKNWFIPDNPDADHAYLIYALKASAIATICILLLICLLT